MRALSQTPFATRLLAGPVTDGVCLGHGHLLVSGRVLSLTRPGDFRMPNGLECALGDLEPDTPVRVGGGRLECDLGSVSPGPLWNPRPSPRFVISTHPGLRSWPLLSLAGLGPGLTPLGDDVATGYLAARTLFGAGRRRGRALAESLAAQTTSLSGTLLRLATDGQLPEAAHRLLEDGDPEPLLGWGATSGSGLMVGLGLFRVKAASHVVRRHDLSLHLDRPRRASIEIRAVCEMSSPRT